MSSENLNPEQKANWDHAVKEYQEIQEANVQSRFKLMSVKERQQYKQNHGCVSDQDILTHMRSLNFILGVSVSNSNSVLFTRLLNGKRPLIYAPPTSFTSPWYSVVEDNGPWEIHSEAKYLEEMFEGGNPDKGIDVEGSTWKIKEQLSPTSALLTYFGWERLGYTWKLERLRIPAVEADGFICCWHNPKIKRITTLALLRKEQYWHVRRHYEKIQMVLDADFATKKKLKATEQYGTLFANGMFNIEFEAGQTLLKKRRKANLPDYPTEEEILKEVEKNIQSYFERRYSLDKSGKLYKWVWRLSRVTPEEINKKIYM